MKKLLFYFYISIFLFSIVGCATENQGLQKISIAGHKIKVEIADTPKLRFQGLSNRESLPKNHGMLFVFPNYTKTSFIMRDMKFPLDIIWIKDNKVISCSKNLPAPKAGEEPVMIDSLELFNYVLEVNAGFCEKYEIKQGSEVEL